MMRFAFILAWLIKCERAATHTAENTCAAVARCILNSQGIVGVALA